MIPLLRKIEGNRPEKGAATRRRKRAGIVKIDK